MNTKTPECYTTDTQARLFARRNDGDTLLVLPLDQFVFAEWTAMARNKNCVWFLSRMKF